MDLHVTTLPFGMSAITLGVLVALLIVAIPQGMKWRNKPETKVLGDVTLEIARDVFIVLLFGWYIPLGLAVLALTLFRAWVDKKLHQLARHRITALPIGVLLGIVLYAIYALYFLALFN